MKSRREFLKFMGYAVSTATVSPFLVNCANAKKSNFSLPFSPLSPTDADDLVLAKGFESQILIEWGEKINSKNDLFGFNNDYLALIPLNTIGTEALLWVNHESPNPLFVSGATKGMQKTKAQVVSEQKSVGGSLLHIEKANESWQWIRNSNYNRRLDGTSPIPFSSARPIDGSRTAIGTLANCAGGITPWSTVLTCEENYDEFYGEYKYTPTGPARVKSGRLQWESYFNYSPEHYGWVVEVEPKTGKAKKLVSLGRFAHEGATPVLARDGRCVVYMADDAKGQCVYKFISEKPGQLDSGELFVADTENGNWLSLDHSKQSVLQSHFRDQTDVLIRCREAAKLVGGTPLDRPEDIEIHPRTQEVYITLTNNTDNENFHGQIAKIVEDNRDPLSSKFSYSTFIAGGEDTGFSCPDNLAFDNKGNLWMTSDISGKAANKPPYTSFKNNGLFYIPMSGPDAGVAFQVASAPIDAELTGPQFSSDFQTLFLSVQHPGENTKEIQNPTSRWPNGALPKPAVVAISGRALAELTNSG